MEWTTDDGSRGVVLLFLELIWDLPRQELIDPLNRIFGDVRQGLLRHATNIKDSQLPVILRGVKINTSLGDYLPVEQAQLLRFDGERRVRFGDIVGRP